MHNAREQGAEKRGGFGGGWGVGEGGGHDGKETCHDKGFSEGNNLSSLELGRFALSRKFRHFF